MPGTPTTSGHNPPNCEGYCLECEYGPRCADCGSQEELHEYTNPDLTKEKVCERCFRKRNGDFD